MILNVNGESIYNTDAISTIYVRPLGIDNEYYLKVSFIHSDDTVIIGQYNTQERAKKVLNAIYTAWADPAIRSFVVPKE